MGIAVTILREADDDRPQPTTRAVALVPAGAVTTIGDQTYAFVLGADDTVERRAVTTGGLDGDRLEVLGGLTAGERVIMSPPDTLTTGSMVVVR